MGRQPLKKLVLLLTVLALCSVAQAEKDAFHLSEGDLPTATVAGNQVAFTRNGAIIVSQQGRVVFDGGLLYATANWDEWGTQVRRSARDDSWELTEAQDELITRGTLHDIDWNAKFTFVQRTTLTDKGLRLRYEVTPLKTQPIAIFGVVFHLPVSRTAGGEVQVISSDRTAPLPMAHTKGVLLDADGEAAEVHKEERKLLAVRSERTLQWLVYDDRAWGLNTFRVAAADSSVIGDLSDGKKVRFTVDVELPEPLQSEKRPLSASRDVPPESFSEEDAPLVVPLSDDDETRGDWLGTYGRYAYYLCAMRSPYSLYGGLGWPVDMFFYTGDPAEPRRAWQSSAPAEGDRSVLLEPNGLRRTPAAFDDHGESRAPGEGPDLHIDLEVPPGAFLLSLYFFEVDWIQYRAYTIVVVPGKGTGAEPIETRVEDFFRGKYKRFAVLGPAYLHLIIRRGESPNAQVSGIFLDRLGPPDTSLLRNRLDAVPWPAEGAGLELAGSVVPDDPMTMDASTIAGLSDGNSDEWTSYLRTEQAYVTAATDLAQMRPRVYCSKLEEIWKPAQKRARAVAQLSGGELYPRLKAALLWYYVARAGCDFPMARAAASEIATLLGQHCLEAEHSEDEADLLRRYALSMLKEGRRREASPLLEAYATYCLECDPQEVACNELLDLGHPALVGSVPLPIARALDQWQDRYGPLLPSDRLLLANLYYLAGKNNKAVTEYQAAEPNMDAGPRHAWVLIAIITAHLRADEIAKAVDVLQRLKELYPSSPYVDEARFRFGEHHFRQRNLADAKGYFEGLRTSQVYLMRTMSSQYLQRVKHLEEIEKQRAE